MLLKADDEGGLEMSDAEIANQANDIVDELNGVDAEEFDLEEELESLLQEDVADTLEAEARELKHAEASATKSSGASASAASSGEVLDVHAAVDNLLQGELDAQAKAPDPRVAPEPELQVCHHPAKVLSALESWCDASRMGP